MYYVVDQSNPKEPMEYIRVTSEDIDELKEIQIQRFTGKPINDDEISLCQYVLEDIDVPSYYDTKPVRVGTMYTYLLNMYKMSLDDQYNINFYNDIDFILFFEKNQNAPFDLENLSQESRQDLIIDNVLNFIKKSSKKTTNVILNKYITDPLLNKNISQINLINDKYAIYSLYHDFKSIESTTSFIFNKLIIHSLDTLINIISSSNYSSLFKSKKLNDIFEHDYYELENFSNEHRYFRVLTSFMVIIKTIVPTTKDKYYETLLRYLIILQCIFESSLYIDDIPDNMNLEESIHLLFTIYGILHLYQSLHIEVSNYKDLFNSADYSFEKYESSVTYKIKNKDCNSSWFWNNDIKTLCKTLNDILHDARVEDEFKKNIHKKILKEHINQMDTIYSADMPLEFLVIQQFFILLANRIASVDPYLSRIGKANIGIANIIERSIKNCQTIILPDNYVTIADSFTEIGSFLSQSINNQIFKRKNILYYNLKIHTIIDLFKPAIESYLLFSKHPIDQCSHCHMFFLKTSPNRKFCDSALTLKSGMTCKEEREAITDQKSEYQKTTNDFKQYLQKVTLKGDEPYTRRVYNILEKNKYFDSKKTKNFEEKPKMSKSDTKDLLWMLNSFFNYSYAIMESMNFQKIVKDPTFKDIRYYNNSPENNFTPDAYKKLFKEYKIYTRTNKGNKVTEVFNIYDSLVKFSESKDSELSFKTIRSKSMQKLNGDDIAKLFEITETVIHVFFLKLSEWYLEDPDQDYPSFKYAFPKEYATSELGNIQYINKNANDNIENIDNLKEKIKKKRNDPYIAEDIKTKVQINGAREKQVIKLITELREKIFDNHPFK
ncbi:hypothetical protein [uncultured Holdemanella sp.]|uniref:hypothetical protein n=1 Tax=uncultured Holdemanella sp. TaxID=1763549 RepID=UPI0025D442CB|nr:hypothetical protein [uncultured Holdemanella sp.]